MVDLKSIVGEKIKSLRKLKKWTQAELAEKVGIEPVSIARIETGLNFPKEENLVSIANALNIEVSELFSKDEAVDKETIVGYIQSTITGLNDRDLNILYNMVKTMSCC